MKDSFVRVLMLGEKSMASSALLEHLSKNGCNCTFATSADDGIKLFERHHFHIVLNSGPVRQAMRMLPALAESDCSVFSVFPVEHGSWWLPVMQLGRECIGVPAMRTAEFVSALDQLLAQIRVKELAIRSNSLERSYFIPSLDRLAS